MKALTHNEQVNAFEAEMRAVINRFAHEFDLTICDAIGSLEIIKLELYRRQCAIREAAAQEDGNT